MNGRRCILALGLGMAADAALGCSPETPEPAPTSNARLLPPADLPQWLVGICVVPAPAALFALCRDGYDLPVTGSSWATFAAGALGLPITASEAFDLAGQVRVALLGPGDGKPAGAVVALPLRAPDRLIAVSTLGESARFRSEKDDALHGERLVPTSAGKTREIGVLRNHLVVGPAGSLTRAGAFLSDPAQPSFAPTGEGVSGWVHGLVLADLLASQVARLDPKPQELLRDMAPELRALENALRSIAKVPFALLVSTTMSSLRLSLPKNEEIGATFASLTSGELSGMLATDRDAGMAISLFQAEADRVKAAEWIAKLLPALGAVSQPTGAVRDALVALARARADGFQLAVERGPAGLIAYGSCDLDDEDAARGALSTLTKVSGEPQKNSGVIVGIVDTRLTRIGEAVHVFVDREEPGKDPQAELSKQRLASVLMRIEGGRLALATGSDAVSALKKALRRRAEEGPASLADLSVVKALVPALPARAALCAYLDPAGFFSEARPSSDPDRERSALGLTVEVAADDVALTVALEPTALRALLRLALLPLTQGTL